MREIRDYSDRRTKAWCIHCGCALAATLANRDHVPTKSLLSRPVRDAGRNYDVGEGERFEHADGDSDVSQGTDYLPQVLICQKCNSSFSDDETYLVCVLHAVMSGSLTPDEDKHPHAARVLRSNGHVVAALRDRVSHQPSLFEEQSQFALFPDMKRIERVIIKNARGHAFHETGTAPDGAPERVWVAPFSAMCDAARKDFESIGSGLDLWPEVGSRMLLRVIHGEGLAGGWVEVESGRYRYALDWSGGTLVRTVMWDYLATETYWPE